MIKTDIVAEMVGSEYRIPVDMGGIAFSIKFDNGAGSTVVSIDAYAKNLSDDEKNRIKDYCESHSSGKSRFRSASGDFFFGYPVIANNVFLGNTCFKEFYYYIVIENKRNISLLGVDFLDNCEYVHKPHENIVISSFDEISYSGRSMNIIDNNDLVTFIDSL
ncbi:MAG: retropepsin-like domain-containing protein [Lachnospiraceae bacterium]|nr:retropepsin-like domain-containing protein [Lachnospiraceae bacterium]